MHQLFCDLFDFMLFQSSFPAAAADETRLFSVSSKTGECSVWASGSCSWRRCLVSLGSVPQGPSGPDLAL